MRALAMTLILMGAQDDLERKVDELAKGLVEEDLEAQDRAAAALAALGPGAVDAIKKRAERAEGDLKARLLAAVTEIERRERMKEYLAGPSIVTLKAEKMPLQEALDALKKQAKSRASNVSGVKDDPVSVDLQNVPYFEAVDRVCRAHGGLVMRIPLNGWGLEEGITIAKGDPTRAPRKIEGAFIVELAAVTLTSTSDFGGSATEEMRLDFRAGSEKGNRPTGAKVKITSLVDEKGTSYVEHVAAGREFGGGWQWVPNQFNVAVSKIPPAEVKSLKEVAGVLELEFPADIEVIKVENPVGQKGVAVAGASLSFKLVECTKSERAVKCVIETGPDVDLWNRDFKLVDKSGKKHGTNGWSSTSDGTKTTATLDFPVPEGAEIVELRLTQPKSGGTRKIAFTFENLPVRP
jgi:hypothetical protein